MVVMLSEKQKKIKWKKENPESVKSTNRKFRKKLKLQVLAHYAGGKPKCSCCWETGWQFLTLHSDEKVSAKQRNSASLYFYLRKNKYPAGYFVLCFNCHWARVYFGRCHERENNGRRK